MKFIIPIYLYILLVCGSWHVEYCLYFSLVWFKTSFWQHVSPKCDFSAHTSELDVVLSSASHCAVQLWVPTILYCPRKHTLIVFPQSCAPWLCETLKELKRFQKASSKNSTGQKECCKELCTSSRISLIISSLCWNLIMLPLNVCINLINMWLYFHSSYALFRNLFGFSSRVQLKWHFYSRIANHLSFTTPPTSNQHFPGRW